MKKKIAIILFIISLIICITHRDVLNVNPLKNIEITNPTLVTRSTYDNSIIIADNSGERVYKIDENGKAVFLIESGYNSDLLNKAINITVDKNGYIYILDVNKSGDQKLLSEKIIVYSPNGKFERTISDLEYDKNNIKYKNTLSSIEIQNDNIVWFQLLDNSFQLISEQGVQSEFKFDNANKYILDFAINPKTNKIYYLTKDGVIHAQTEDNKFTQVYSVENKEGYWIPWIIDFDENGNLYYSDIGQRTLYLIKDKQIEPLLCNNSTDIDDNLTIDEIKEFPIYYEFDANDGILTTDNSTIIIKNNDGQISYKTSYPLSLSLIIYSAIIWLCLFIVMILAISIIVLELYLIFSGENRYKKIVASMLIGTLLLVSVFFMVIIQDWNNRMNKQVMERTSNVSLLLSDIIPSDIIKNIDSIDDYYSKEYQELTKTLNTLFISNIDKVNDLYYCIYKVQDGVITLISSIEDSTGSLYPYSWTFEGSDEQKILTEKKQISYSGLESSEGSFIFTNSPILDDDGNAVGIVEVGTSLDEFQKENTIMIIEVFISTISLAITLILIISEILIFFEGRQKRKKLLLDKQTNKQIPAEMLRILVFLIFFVTNMPKGFLPIYIMKQAQNENLMGLSPAMLVSIALAAEVLFGAIMSFAGDIVISKIGRRKSAIVGSLIFFVGLTMRAVVPTVLSFIIGNSIMGAGWGILLLLVQILIAEKDDEEEKTIGFTGYTAASLSGVNCGTVVGAFLINWLSYTAVLAIIGLLSAYSIVFSYMYIKNDNINHTNIEQSEQKNMSTLKFIFAPKVFFYFIGIVIPVVASGYFLSYLYPLLGAELGISESNIGYSYLINGACIICLGNMLTRSIANKIKQNGALVSSAILYVLSFALYAIYPSVITLLLTLLLMGISDSYGLPIQSTYYTDLEEVEKYGYGRAMGVYSLFENLSQVIGSFIFGVIYMYDVRKGLLVASVVLLIAAALFFVSSIKGKVK